MKKYLLLILCFLFLLACQEDKEKPASQNSSKTTISSQKKLFQVLHPSRSGINFQNILKEDPTYNIFNFAYMYNGGAVGVGDINNDGLPDVYLVASRGSSKLYLNKGNLKFEEITEQARVVAETTSLKTGVTMVDINGDGLLDIYQCTTGRPPSEGKNFLYINQGDLSFKESAAAYGLEGLSSSTNANFFDYDLDGDLDMYLVNHLLDDENANTLQAVYDKNGKAVRSTKPKNEYESDRFYRNNGNNTFTEVTKKVGIENRAYGLSATVTDFNNDNYPDIYLANDYIEPDVVYINQRNGTFRDETSAYLRHMSNNSMGVDIADINNDGLQDILSLDMMPETNYQQKRLKTTIEHNVNKRLVKFDYGYQVMRNALHLNNGENQFSEIACLANIFATDWSWSTLIADLDNDEYKDVFITNGYRRNVADLDYVNFEATKVINSGGGPLELFKVIPVEPVHNYVFQNNGNLDFVDRSEQWGFQEPTMSVGAAYADLDLDGDLDLIAVNYDAFVFVYENKGTDNNYLQIQLKGEKPNAFAVGAKVRLYYGDKQQFQELSPTRGYISSVEYLLHFGLGQTEKIDKIVVEWPDKNVQEITKVNVNQRLLIEYKKTTLQAGKTNVKPLFNKADILSFQHMENDFTDFDYNRLQPHLLSKEGPALSVADVNADGLEDLFIGGASGQANELFLQQRNGQFSRVNIPAFQKNALREAVDATFFDADNDGDQDLYLANGGNFEVAQAEVYADALYLNDGQGNFELSTNALPQGIHTSTASVLAWDYDEDGDHDLIVAGRHLPRQYPRIPETHVFQNQGNGTFEDVSASIGGALQKMGMCTDLLATKLEAQGTTKLLAVGEWMPVSIFEWDGQRFVNQTKDYGLTESTGWWNVVKAADFDQDGDMDLIAGNLGLNSRLKASTSYPTRIYAADFDDNGQIDPILTWYQEGREYPILRKDLLTTQLPFLKGRIRRYAAFGKASIQEIFTAEELQNAQVLEANYFETSYFENTGQGFKLLPLPVEAQFAPVKDILVNDWNKDGLADLLLIGNDYTPEVELGRIDASSGTLLINKGAAKWQVIPNRVSGFWATEEARKIARVGNKVVVANNNSAAQVYQWQEN